jgi:hypothetical protein
VESVSVHWANRNLPPLWEGVEVLPPGLVVTRTAPPDDIGIERVPLETQKLIPALGYGGGEKRSFRRGAQAFLFKATVPSGNPMQYRIRLLPDQGAPMDLEKAWGEKFFTFDTLLVPDGKYRLEVTASDSAAQPFSAAPAATWRTPVFIVDHTPPVISALTAVPEGDGVRVRFTAQDASSLIKEAALSADGGEWLQLVPEDGLFDMQANTFNVLIPRDRVKGSRVLVRVADTNSNEQTASVLIGGAKK